jgi:tubulin beta
VQGINITLSAFNNSSRKRSIKILERLRQEHPSILLNCSVLYPSGDWNCSDFEIYNAILTTSSLIDNADMVTMFDNTAISKACGLHSKLDKPSLRDMNQALAQYLSNVTANFRFPGQLNASLRKLATNLVPFPRLKFFKASQTSWGYAPENYHKEKLSTMVSSVIIGKETGLFSIDSRHGRFMTAAIFGRGFQCANYDLDQAVLSVQSKNSSYFVEYFPSNITVSYSGKSGVLSNDAKLINTESLACMAMTTASQELFKGLTERFTQMFRRKARVHYLIAGGISKMTLTECESSVNDLASSFQQYQDAVAQEDIDEE